MTEERIHEICTHFDIDGEATGFNTLKDGHINNTYAVSWKHGDAELSWCNIYAINV